MRIRKTNILFALSGVVVVAFIFYIFGGKSAGVEQDGNTFELEKKVEELERELRQNHDMLRKMGKSVAQLLASPALAGQPDKVKTMLQEKLVSTEYQDVCRFAEKAPLKSDINMLELYRQLKFDNTDGGAWKQGWNVQYDPADFSGPGKKLKVFVVPHSHNDPGWIKTLEKYYEDQTRHIFNNMVRKLAEETSRKFIWAEISYLDLWWQESSPEKREAFRELVKSGQIEIVTGGWVMNDEANSHYYAIIEQLTTGHEWVKQKLGVIPVNGWAIDPFGFSSSMPYVLKKSGMQNMVIQRVHYSVKKALARQKNLEFRWRQNWDRDGQTDMFCHLMPFYSYDVPHTCGPDPKVCCQFDFRRLSYAGQKPMSCPWKVPPAPITDLNVQKKAFMLLDQYRKKSVLYRTNVLLVPLGDDFRYDTAAEYDQQYVNYQKLFDYMNSRRDWMVEAKFGTLKDYFDALRSRVAQSVEHFPSLSGDFFTYADVDDHYWSGYFTSRPFHKQLDRSLGWHLRSAEILYSLTWSHLHRNSAVSPHSAEWMTAMMADLTRARQNMGLFQHHDGITGTAKEHVMKDYAKKMQVSIQNSQRVIEQCAHYLLNKDQVNFKPELDVQHFIVDDSHSRPDSLPDKTVLELDSTGRPRLVVLYNPLASHRVQVVTLRVSHYNIQVMDERSQPVKIQLSPVFFTPHQVSIEEFEVSFIVTLPPLGMSSYTIRTFNGPVAENMALEVASVVVRDSRAISPVDPFVIRVDDQLEPFHLSNDRLEAGFDADGLLSYISTGGVKTPVAVQFVKYGTNAHSQNVKSGAYLFLPDGPATVLNPEAGHHIRCVRGSIRSQVVAIMPFVVHQITLFHSPGIDGASLHVENLVNVAGHSNTEVGMRLVTRVASDRALYTDLNGLQMTRRERFDDKLPLQALFYPMPTMAFIEDDSVRLTLAAGQPLGVASLQSGQLEVMMDRRLDQDDNRGLFEGVTDNVNPTMNSFRLFVERRVASCKGSGQRPDGYPSVTAHKSLYSLLYPIHRLIYTGQEDGDKSLQPSLKPANDIGPDVHLVNLRTGATLSDDSSQPTQSVALTVHRWGVDCCLSGSQMSDGSFRSGELNIKNLFPDYFGDQVTAASLTQLNTTGPTTDRSHALTLKPMEVYTFLLQP